MKAFLSFIVGVLVGIAGHWYFAQPKPGAALAETRESVRREATELGQTVKDTLETDRLKEELDRTGKVIREKAKQAGNAIADTAANASTTAAIKGKLLKTSNLAALKIDVDTTDGVVTLSGTASTHEEVAQAVNLALETEGVHKVVSTIQVKPN